MKTFSIILLLFASLFWAGDAFAQKPESEAGIKLYKQGDFKGAAALLKNSDEAEDLFWLGSAYEKMNEKGKAKEAFKKSFAKSYDIFFKKFREWQKDVQTAAKKSFSDFLQEVKANNQLGRLAAEKAFNLKADIFQTNEGRIKAKVLFDTVVLAQARGEIYASSDELISAPKITEKPRASSPKDLGGIYTRRDHPQNKPLIVNLFAVLGADGEIKLLMPTDDIIDPYTAETIRAAEKIKFKTASKDNKPVTSHINISHSFSFG